MFSFDSDYSANLSNYYAVSSGPTQQNGSVPLYSTAANFSTELGSSVYRSHSSQQAALGFSIASILGEDSSRRSSQLNVPPPQQLSANELLPPVEHGTFTSEVTTVTHSHSATVPQPHVTSTSIIPSQQFKGTRVTSKYGKKNSLLYCVPGTLSAYTFCFDRKNKSSDVYRCIFCKSAGFYVTVKVIDDVFLTDPCSIVHRCSPRAYTEETTKRMLYQKMDKIRSNERFTNSSPLGLWLEGLQEIKDNVSYDDSVKAEVLSDYFDYGFDRRKRQFTRNLAHHKDKRASMAFVPEDLRTLSDGTAFLQEDDPNFHIYFSQETIQKACIVGLQAIVADGVHTPQPKELGRHSQLYCVHGVCDGGFDVPLLYAITARKTERVYTRIFEHLKTSLEQAGINNEGESLRIVLDYEKAAINAAKSSFPKAKVEGCAFHLAQAWNRKKNALGLQQHMKGPLRDPRISRWWATIKGVMFLPEELRNGVRALRLPPVLRSHPAYDKCTQFLRYVRSTWLSGPFKDLWCKWKISTLRTTNIAEAFHSKLKSLIRCDHPDLATLISHLRVLNLQTNCSLERKITKPDEMKRLRRRDADRRIKIDLEVSRFAGRYHAREVTTREITKYCAKMSRHVTGRAV